MTCQSFLVYSAGTKNHALLLLGTLNSETIKDINSPPTKMYKSIETYSFYRCYLKKSRYKLIKCKAHANNILAIMQHVGLVVIFTITIYAFSYW